MPNWLRNLRLATVRPIGNRSRRSSKPSVEKLEDRTVLQSGLSSNQAFVTAAYNALLNRAPDAGGLAFWTNVLNSGQATTLQVAQSMVNSREFQTVAVQNLYQTLLQRSADAGGLSGFVNYLAAGGTIRQVEVAILASPEYFQTRGGGTNAGFVQALYLDVLKRPADQAGLQGFTQALAAGVTRQQVAQIIVDSPEGITVDVQSLYSQLLHRNADAGGLSTFVTALEQNDPPSNPNMFPNDPPANATGSASAQRNINGSASATRNVVTTGASFTLPAGTVVTPGVTVPAGSVAISIPGLTLPAGAFAVLLPGQTLPTGATILPDVVVPAGAETITIPGVTVPSGTVLVPALGTTLPSGEVVGFQTTTTTNGSASDQRNVNGSASAPRNAINETAGVSFILPTGTGVTPGVTVPAGSVAISIPGVTLPSGAVAILLPGQTLPTGATILTGVTITTGAVTITIPGVTLPAGTLVVPLVGATLPNGQIIGITGNANGSASAQRNVNGSASAQRNTDPPGQGMSQEQVIAAMVGSPEFFQRASA